MQSSGEAKLYTTPLLEEHKKLKAKLAPFGGWLMPIQYSGIIEEHNWTRNNCSLFDICHMGEFFIKGEVKKSNLDKILTANLTKMPLGSCRYGFMLAEDGGIIDDVITYKIKDDFWMLVVNGATIIKDEAHIRKNLSKDAELENVSKDLGKLDLQGPASRDILKDIFREKIKALEYYGFDSFSILGENNIISRTGYTGELGFELYISKDKVVELWNLLLQNQEVKPAGLGARDTLRLEMGYPLYGQDLSEEFNPCEAGFARFVDFDKEFIGKKALLKKKNPLRKLSYFKASSRRSPRHNYKIYKDGKEIGIVTSGSFSPSLSCGIGMGYIKESYNKKGSPIIISDGKVEIEAIIAEKPFYKRGSIKS